MTLLEEGRKLLEKDSALAPRVLAIVEELLGAASTEAAPVLHAQVKHLEGQCYVGLTMESDDPEDLLRAMACFEAALELFRGADEELAVARVLTELGEVNVWLIADAPQDAGGHADRALHAFHEAAQVHSAERFPRENAALKIHMGTAYLNLGLVGESRLALKRAVTHFEEAQRFFTADAYPAEAEHLKVHLSNAREQLNGRSRG